MSEEDIEKWAREGQNRGMYMVTSCSSFEMLDPHDPVISCLATQMFEKTDDYLQGEISTAKDHYILMEDVYRMTATKYADLRNLTVNLSKTLNEYNEMYNAVIKPLLTQIDQLEEQLPQFENNAYRLDCYTKQLKARFKELEEK